MLAQRIEQLCAHLLPGGRREGHEWVDAKRANGGLGDSMRVHIIGARRGVWAHFANAGARGDALDLVAYVKFSGDKKKAIMWAKSYLGLDNADPGRLKEERAKAQKISKAAEEKAAAEKQSKRNSARAMWLNARPALKNTPVDLYLLGRGISLNDLERAAGRLPGSIRFAPALRHANGQEYPAMIAQVNNGAGEFIAAHRTYLHSPQPYVVTKAPLGDQAKMVLGSYAGGFITLNRGASNKPLNQAPEGDHVVLCEGIEDGLSIALECPDRRVLACIAVGNIRNIILPPAIKIVTIAKDNDAPDSPAAKSLQVAIDKFIDEGREVFLASSPHGKDFNDCLTAKAVQERALQ